FLMESMAQANRDKFVASGFVYCGKHAVANSNGVINEGLWTAQLDVRYSNLIFMGRAISDLNGTSKTDHAVININGMISHITNVRPLASTVPVSIKLPPAPDGTVTYDSATNTIVKHATPTAAFSAETGTNKVVVNRKDIFAGEFFLRKVDPVTGRLYKDGMINGRETNWLGKATTESSRAISWYAAYSGDTTSRGLSHALADLTFAELAMAMSDPKTNAWYMENGDLVQWSMRQKAFAGAGNGNWLNIDPTSSQLGYSANLRVPIQGDSDTVEDWVAAGATNHYYGASGVGERETGVFTAYSGKGTARNSYNGLAFLHVWGSVSRLNQGKTHPFNSLGSALCSDSKKWHETTDTINSLKDCFINPVGGDIASAKSGRDGGNLYHDGIGPSGQGGIIDDRLSAWDMGSPEEAAKFDAKVKNGVARGEAMLPFTEIATQEGATNNSVTDFFVSKTVVRAAPEIGSKISQVSGATVITRRVVRVTDTGTLWQVFVDEAYNRTAGAYVISQSSLNLSVEGNATNGFTVQDVLGSPSNIIKIAALQGGWLGYWISDLATASADRALTRKCITPGNIQVQYSDNLGAAWITYSQAVSTITNSATNVSLPDPRVLIFNYTASPYVTQPSENEVVFNGEAGIGSVFTSCYYNAIRGVLFAESLLHKVLTNNTSMDGLTTNYRLNKVSMYDGRIDAASQRPTTHEPISLGAPSNNSVAVKALMRQVSKNGGLHLGYNFKEMKHKALGTGAVSADGSTSFSYKAATLYRITGGSYKGRLVYFTEAYSNLTLDNLFLRADGRFTSSTGSVFRQMKMFEPQHEWGDDGIIQAIHNTSTINDYNGVSCLYGSVITKRYGWSN
ncbi:hypothetical protein ACWX0P_17735, partial [Vibrio mediterranei]